MRRGKKIDTVKAAETNKEALARMMIGREVIFSSRRTPQKAGEEVVEIDQLTLVSDERRELLKRYHSGGARRRDRGRGRRGRQRAARAGERHHRLDKADRGKIKINGQDITQATILERRRLISFVPQDRGKMGAAIDASIMENAAMTHHRLNPKFTRWKGLLMDYKEIERVQRPA